MRYLLDKALKKIDSAIQGFSTVMLAIFMIILFVQVFFRYVLRDSIFWAEEVCRFGFVWIVLIGAVMGISAVTEVRMDLLESKYPPLLKKIYRIFWYAACMFAAGFITYCGYQQVIVGGLQTSACLRISMKIVYACIPIGFGLMALFALQKLIYWIKKPLSEVTAEYEEQKQKVADEKALAKAEKERIKAENAQDKLERQQRKLAKKQNS